MFTPRSHERLRQTGQVSARILSQPGGGVAPQDKFLCTIQDLSLGGARLSAHAPVRVGTILEIQFAFREPETRFLLKAQAVWVHVAPGQESCTFGAQFVDTPVEILSEWQKVIGRKLVEQAAARASSDEHWL